jgi:hypothetical protein
MEVDSLGGLPFQGKGCSLNSPINTCDAIKRLKLFYRF